MRNITLDEIQPGMYLSKSLVLDDGTVLLHEGIEMKERYIQYLRNQGITSLFVGQPKAQDFPVTEDFYDLKHRQEAAIAAKKVVNQFRVGKGVQLDGVKDIVSSLITQLSQQPENMIHLLDIRRKQEYMFSHAVNTCILSVMTGLALGYDNNQLSELGLAAMLHDIGKIKFSRQLALQFPDYLSKDEREEYRRHPFYALEVLRENPGLPVNVINACFQHHERWNGSGYPMGIQGDSICEYAQIISIADVYDRLIAGLPHRLPTPVYYAVAILNKASGEYFNPALVDIFNQNVAIFPMGKSVRLNTQESGVILGVGIKNKTTPIVRVTTDKNGNPVNQPIELDLIKNPGLFILDFEDPYFNYAQAYADKAYNNMPSQEQSVI
ncbi:HD-GYP domain-containing protein (c-di-GMP phosphodiesterase class II) [Anaerospora hongkongensis]|uniref:HD-GYP domain-containing protein (C-di-GMP phosphodiesterase class II) n=1 Tax=Anaerospora hongkongensis TaxID=244830 RepID=A0A4R1Q281_9FIRM|nr:HD-GYP domain-containing protein [Anaerospora hongkongensis]TCL39319.1 HD-GYP domain-containing protein (c-di-GMP phosphodiesterase class II) [Anaerospora hongkongensis]